MHLKSVDLPLPEEPMILITSPLFTEKSMSLSVTREDITLMASFEEVIKKDEQGEKIASKQIKSLTNSFIRKIEKLLVKIDNNYNIRAKYINLCIFLRYGF